MDDERWSRLAFALGMPYGETSRASFTARKFVEKIRSRRFVGSKEMTELLIPLLASIAKDHKTMKCQTQTLFHRDGVPDEIPDFEIEDGWKMQLPTPKPAITLGYSKTVFTSHQLELQQGIISNSKNEPSDLHKLSQPVPGVYWPFFVVEADDESMLAARNACAGSAATCNNALMIFAGATQEPQKSHRDVDLLWSLSKAAQSFSLAINGRTACLNTHNSAGCLPHAVAVIRTYRLDDEKEVEAMAARISSILIWAGNSRLQSICDLIYTFGQRVRLAKNTIALSEDLYAPTELVNFGVVSKTRMGIIKESW